jgi:hypothetical protein
VTVRAEAGQQTILLLQSPQLLLSLLEPELPLRVLQRPQT